jgi:hypothetical protein
MTALKASSRSCVLKPLLSDTGWGASDRHVVTTEETCKQLAAVRAESY